MGKLIIDVDVDTAELNEFMQIGATPWLCVSEGEKTQFHNIKDKWMKVINVYFVDLAAHKKRLTYLQERSENGND